MSNDSRLKIGLEMYEEQFGPLDYTFFDKSKEGWMGLYLADLARNNKKVDMDSVIWLLHAHDDKFGEPAILCPGDSKEETKELLKECLRDGISYNVRRNDPNAGKY